MTNRLRSFSYRYINGNLSIVYYTPREDRNIEIVMSIDRYQDMLHDNGYNRYFANARELPVAISKLSRILDKLTEDEIEAYKMEAILE
jgi:hypothetical protein